MNLARKLSMAGDVTVLRIPRNGFYEHGLPKDISRYYRGRSRWQEATLRARLAAKGFVRGLRGTGVLAVGRLFLTQWHCTCGRPESHKPRPCPAAEFEHFGLCSTEVITNAGVTFLRDDWNNNAQDFTTFNFHGIGTGAVAENVTDTALGTESTTALNPDSTRATGTRSVPSSNVFRSVGTLTADASIACTEHGLFSTSGTGTGTLWDRSVFSVVNLANGDSLQATYDGTLSAGG